MRHGDKIKNLSRTASHRTALLCNLTIQLIQHKRITTTLAKARALRVFAEPLITRSKDDTMHNRRIVFSYLQDKEAIKELFGVISDKVADRPGGYTRIIKLPRRMGDASDMALIELVDFNEIYGREEKKDTGKKTRRSRRGGSGAKTQATTATETVTDNNDTVTDADIDSNDQVADASHEEETVEATTETPVAEVTEEATEIPVAEVSEEATEAPSAEDTTPEADTTSDTEATA